MTIRERYAQEIARAIPSWAGSKESWGVDDCVMAIANIDLAVTGKDTAADYRGRYRTERGSRRVLGKAGLPGALNKAARKFGWPRLAKKKVRGRAVIVGAQDGDRALAVTPAGYSMVIHYRGRWFGRCDYGNVMVNDSRIFRAWKVAD